MVINVGAKPTPVKQARVIALTTDFGLGDAYVGVMKGVILGICPGAQLVDVTHGVPPQDVLAGCLALEAARPYFPPNTVHLAVVDPGVGSDRAALAVRTDRETFVAPDNGLLSFLGDQEILEIRVIENPWFRLHPVSRTFHGRDVFAPAAAHLASGAALARLGPRTDRLCRLPVPEPTRTPEGIRGEVLTFDHFGNAVTSIRETDVPAEAPRAQVKGLCVPIAGTYSDVAPGDALCLVGSARRLEISVRNGNARDSLDLHKGDPILVRS